MSGKSELARVTNIKNGRERHTTWTPSCGFVVLPQCIVKMVIDKQTTKKMFIFHLGWLQFVAEEMKLPPSPFTSKLCDFMSAPFTPLTLIFLTENRTRVSLE